MSKLLVINGPNLNMLGIRDTSMYGIKTLQDINQEISCAAEKNHLEVDFFQSNIEGEIINTIQGAYGAYQGIIINPGAYTHYSYAIRDAIEAVNLPVIEVHISNIYKREEFRRKSVISDVCLGQINGLGYAGYIYALEALNRYLKEVH
ncbi:MAG: aroQ [Clostridia bacterium]|jgi:3-dehydroquinate dehydratase-2|nr:aroQ [Clostridia bacterium]